MWVSGQGDTHECEWAYLVDLHYFAVVISVSVCGVSGGVGVVVVYELVDGLVDGI